MEKPVSVICYNGICSSQFDNYVGMHMSDESCIACDAILEVAHDENSKRNHQVEKGG